MPLTSHPSSDQRRAFAAFLERLATTEVASADWTEHAATHYTDGHLEGIRRKLVQLAIERDPAGRAMLSPADRDLFRSWAQTLLESPVA